MNYRVINNKIVFPEIRGRKAFEFYTASKWSSHKSWKNLTDTAEVTLAKDTYFKEKVSDLVQSGDPIIIYGGYDGTYNEDFTGYVSSVLDDMPVQLKCEDNMYVLKRTGVHKSYSTVKLAKLLQDIVPSQFTFDAIDVQLGKILLSRTTVSQALTMLKDNYGIYSYFDGNTLISGKIYLDNDHSKTYEYTFFKDIIDNDLAYRRKDDIRLKVTMTSYLSGGTKKKVTVGDTDGQEENLICSNVSNDAELKALAQKNLDRLKFDGYQGSMVVFGDQPIKHGDIVSLKNPEFPERSGRYYVDAVETICNDDGTYHKKLTIGPKAA